MIEFTLPPVETTLGITHPAKRGWAEEIRKQFDAAKKPVPPRDFLDVCRNYVGWAKYLRVTQVAAELALAGWTVCVHNTYTFSAEKEGDRFSAETKARWVEENGVRENQNCWSFSRDTSGD